MSTEQTTDDYRDPLLERAKQVAMNTPHLCVAALQRTMNIGYNRALRLMETMIDEGMVERYNTSLGIGYRLVPPNRD